MQVGDLVKYRRNAVDAGVGIALIEGARSRWTILWSCGVREIVREENLKVINASR